MSFLNSLTVSIFGISMVFIVLISLSFILKLQSVIISSIVKRKEIVSENNDCKKVNICDGNIAQVCNGEVALIDVDEKTAAMIMAIVSDEMGTPLTELQFKYIKAVE